MSYDLQLYRKGIQDLFDKGEVEDALKNDFPYVKEYVDKDKVKAFEVGESREKAHEITHQGPEKNYYWAYCSYGVEKDTFNQFLKDISKISTDLDFLIKDPQVDSINMLEPAKFIESLGIKDERFSMTQKTTSRVVQDLPFILPTKEKHFITYFIMTTNPVDAKDYYLTLGDNKLYASKVEVGESIKDVVDREVIELTGSSEYEILNIKKMDTAKDKHGNELDRFGVYLNVPYFDPQKVNIKQKVVWEEII